MRRTARIFQCLLPAHARMPSLGDAGWVGINGVLGQCAVWNILAVRLVKGCAEEPC